MPRRSHKVFATRKAALVYRRQLLRSTLKRLRRLQANAPTTAQLLGPWQITDLARAAGLHPRTVQKALCGSGSMYAETALRVSRVLGIHPADLVAYLQARGKVTGLGLRKSKTARRMPGVVSVAPEPHSGLDRATPEPDLT